MNCATSGMKTKRPHRRMMLVDVTDDNYQTMLLKHKRRKLEDPVCCGFLVGNMCGFYGVALLTATLKG